MGRYICPDLYSDLNPDKVTLFRIVDLLEIQRKWQFEQDGHANAFALAYHRNNCQLIQIFGFHIPTIGQMIELRGNDRGFYLCWFKTKPRPIGVDLLESNQGLSDDPSASSDKEIIGWGFDHVAHLTLAIDYGVYIAYRECKKEAEIVAKRTGLPLVEIIPEGLERMILSGERNHPNYGLTDAPCTPLYARPFDVLEKMKEGKKK